jgi:hypothetical protein
VEILAVRTKVLGQVIDTSGKQRDLDFAGAGVFIVRFELGDDFVFDNYCGHDDGFWNEHVCRGGDPPVPPALAAVKTASKAGVTV